ncbi:exopolysaccharide biosynthesis polyprenyl glycosylphosphotransferase [Sphingopyxis chilensis]
MKQAGQQVAVQRSIFQLFGSLRVQLLICVLFGVFLPVVLYIRGDLTVLRIDAAAINSSIAATICTACGVLAVRKFGEFPGTIGASYIFPALAISYSVAMVAILLARAPYSGALLMLTFVASLIARFAVGALERRRQGSHYYLVPGGSIDRIRDDLDFASTTLDAPQLPVEPDAIIVADLHYDHSDQWERAFAVAALNGIGVYHYKQVWEASTGKVRIEHLSENSLGSLIPSNSYSKVKRLIDIIMCLVLMPLLLPILLVAAIAIRLDSPGSIFFTQERIGFRAKSFRVLKFRTMRPQDDNSDAGDDLDNAITKQDDARITRVGRFLRQTRIDELPQVLNVLRGEMSWIGPRPEARPLSEWYERELPFYSYRHIVRPGITGWAQVNQGHVAGISEVHDKLRFDFYYIKNFSMWLDLVVLFKTVLVVIRGSGAK